MERLIKRRGKKRERSGGRMKGSIKMRKEGCGVMGFVKKGRIKRRRRGKIIE